MKPPKSGNHCVICKRKMLDPTWYWHPTYESKRALHFTQLLNREVGIPALPICEPCRSQLVDKELTFFRDERMVTIAQTAQEIVYDQYAYYMRDHVEKLTL